MPRAEAPKPRTLMGPYALFFLYRRRLRVHAAQELFAGIGIAIAVALVFAATVAESSIAGSSAEVVRAVTGPASLQLRARDGEGFDERLLGRVEHLPGVKLAAPLLEEPATLRAANGRHTAIDLAGTDTSLAVLDGLGETLPLAALAPGTIGLSKTSAEMIGVPARPTHPITGPTRSGGARYVTLQMRGRATTLRVSAVLGHEAVGALSRALVAVMPLARMQQLAGLPGRITRIFVEAQPGHQAQVSSELHTLAGSRLTVAPANQDVTLLQEALGPSGLASGLFAAIGALREISTLLLVAAISARVAALASSLWQRRAWLAGLRLAGAKPPRLRRILLLEASLMLGAGCLTGALAGIYGQVVIDGYLRQVTGFPLASIVSGARPLEIFVLVLAAAMAIMAIPGWLASRVSPGLALEND